MSDHKSPTSITDVTSPGAIFCFKGLYGHIWNDDINDLEYAEIDCAFTLSLARSAHAFAKWLSE